MKSAASAVVWTLLTIVAQSAARPEPMTVLVPQLIPDGAMERFQQQKYEIAERSFLSQRNGFAQDVPFFPDLLSQVLRGSAVQTQHSPGLSGESLIHQNSAAGVGRVQSIRQQVAQIARLI